MSGRWRSSTWTRYVAIPPDLGQSAGRDELCAVVKANGYGHGAVPVAAAALRGGASWLGVATADEAEELRAAGFTAPVIIFAPLTGAELARAVAADADVTVWSASFLAEACKLGARVHIKFDSGMGRLGVDAATALVLAAGAAAPAAASAAPAAAFAATSAALSATAPATSSAAAPTRLVGLMSHFATAADEDPAFFDEQLARFTALATEMKAIYPGLIAHTANSAAMLRAPHSHFDMVRVGIAIYGLSPFNTDPDIDVLEPALRLSSYVAGIREVQAGDSVGYGRRFIADGPARLAIVPIGYADGVCRALTNRGDVLIDGRRCRITGTISMDQLTVLLPEDHGKPGDEVVFIGRSGGERLLCEETARVLDTINYEIVCDVGAAGGAAVRRRRTRGLGVAGDAGSAHRRPCASLAGPGRRGMAGGRCRARRSDRPPSDDLNLVVRGDASRLAHVVADHVGGAVFLYSERFSTHRVMHASGHADFAPLRGDNLTADLAARDFTVNALAQAVDTGVVIDPLGGRADLQACRLRPLRARRAGSRPRAHPAPGAPAARSRVRAGEQGSSGGARRRRAADLRERRASRARVLRPLHAAGSRVGGA